MPSQALVGARPPAASDRQRIRAAVRLCVGNGQSVAGRIGLEDMPQDEHRMNGRVSPASELGSPRRTHRDGGGWGQFRQGEGADRSRQHPAAVLAAYASQSNPQEHLWHEWVELQEKAFPNRVFNHIDGIVKQLEQSLPRLAAYTDGLRRFTAWP